MDTKMRSAFWQQAKHAVAKACRGRVPIQFANVGAEMELVLVHMGTNKLATEGEKNAVLNEMGQGADKELGAACVELNPGPINLKCGGFTAWLNQLENLESKLRSVSAKHGLEVKHWATVPTRINPVGVERTKIKKYVLVPNYHNTHRPKWFTPKLRGLDLSDAGIVGLLNSFQFTVEAQTIEQALSILNWMYAVSPVTVALSANARILAGYDTGYADCRFEVWRRSHETRSLVEKAQGKTLRIGLPAQYFTSVEQYLREVASYPFILDVPEAALAVGIGLFWRDARLKFANGKPNGGTTLLVEFRPMSMQRTTRECVFMAAFVMGRILWAQQHNETLPDMQEVWADKSRAELYGVAGFKKSYLLEEIHKAISGLLKGSIVTTSEATQMRAFLVKKVL
jgi:hypothetical protein